MNVMSKGRSIVERPSESNRGNIKRHKEAWIEQLSWESGANRTQTLADNTREVCQDRHVVIHNCPESLARGVVLSCFVCSFSVCVCVFGVLPLVKSHSVPGLKIASVRRQSYLYSSHTLPASLNASMLLRVCVCVWERICVCNRWSLYMLSHLLSLSIYNCSYI